MSNAVADSLVHCLTSPNVADSNMEPANLVDVMSRFATIHARLASGIYPKDVAPCEDASGKHVASLTEAVMGVTAGLMAISYAIDNLAAAQRSRG